MKRVHRFLLGGLFALTLIVGVLATFLHSGYLENFLEKRIAAVTGRDVEVGNFDIRVGRCLYLDAESLRIANPEWARSSALIEGRKLSGCAAWLPLFAGRLDFKEAHIEGTRLGLEREGDRVSWEFEEKEDKGSRIKLRHVNVAESSIYFRDSNKKTEVEIKVSGNSEALHLQIAGRFRDAPLRLDAHAPGRLPSVEEPLRVSATAVMGRTHAAAVGDFREFGLEGMDIQLDLKGDNLAELNKLGINLPPTPPYKLHGRLTYGNQTWSFAPFEGRIGDSDLAGTFAYIRSEPRALLRMDIHAKLLDFDDLGPLVGAPPKTKAGETASAEQRVQAQQVAATDRVLPTKPLGMDKWQRMDADVRLRADRVLRPNAIPINSLNAHLRIDDAKLRLQPLTFGIAGGQIKSDIVIEGKQSPPRATAFFDIDNLEMARMFPQLNQQRAAAGKLFGRVKLAGQGKSIAELAGSANGEVTLMVNGGHMSALLLELAGLDAGEAVAILFTRGDKPVPLRCAIADFDLKNGEGMANVALVDTVDTLFLVEGKVDLKKERLDLKVTPQPKDRSLPVIRTPLLVSGKFNDPDVSPQVGGLALRGGAAVALGLVNPLLALLPLVETGPGKDSDCAAFAQLARAEGVKSP